MSEKTATDEGYISIDEAAGYLDILDKKEARHPGTSSRKTLEI